MARIGLVLGSGGVVGHAYHAGVLRALHELTGWDPRTAAVVIGTSAGAQTGALLRAGLSPADLAARAAGESLSPEGRRILRHIGPAEPIPRPRLRAVSLTSPALLLRTLARPWTARPSTLAAALVPAGRVSLAPFAARLNWLFGHHWPEEALWIPAVRLRDGQRVVFGRDPAPVTEVGTAVAASCAVPGWFSPVVIDGRRYVDGGVYSTTNLDLCTDLELDLVVVLSSLTVARGVLPVALDYPARASMRLRLSRDVRRLRRKGTAVVAFQPTAADLAVMGVNAMNPHRRHPVVTQAYESTAHVLAGAEVAERFAALAESAA